jgi:hypothetical protein
MNGKTDKALVVTRQELTPQLWEMLKEVGMTFYRSGNMSIKNAHEGAVKLYFCHVHGLDYTAARGIYFVNGKMGVEGHIIGTLLRKHPDYDYNVEHHDAQGCTIAITRFGDVIGEASFTMEDAERAGLAQKATYKAFPQDLLFWKAISRAQKYFAPDVTNAPIYPRETMQDWVEGEVVDSPGPPDATFSMRRPKPPGHEQLQEQFGFEACMAADVYTATTEQELWTAIDALSVISADAESKQADKERAETVLPTIEDIAAEVEADQSPFKNEAA